MNDLLKYSKFKTHDSLKLRYGYTELDLKSKSSKGIVLLLHGRAEFIEKYLETIKLLVNKGFDVITFDWRGQGLSDREVSNRHKGYVNNFDDYISDLKLFFEVVVKKRKQPVQTTTRYSS